MTSPVIHQETQFKEPICYCLITGPPKLLMFSGMVMPFPPAEEKINLVPELSR